MKKTDDAAIAAAKEAYQAAVGALSEWRTSKKRLDAEQQRLEEQIPRLQQEVDDLEASKSRALGGFVAGTADQAQVTSARKAIADAQDRLEEAIELRDAVAVALKRNNQRYHPIFTAIEPARIAYCDSLAKPLQQSLNEQVREQLMEAFAAWSAPVAGANYATFLEQTFPAPAAEEIEDRVQAFKEKYLAPIENGA